MSAIALHYPKPLGRYVRTGVAALLFSAIAQSGYWGAFLRTNAGTDHQARVQFDTASTGTGAYAPATYIALTANSTAPALTDTTLAGEITTAGGGLVRQQASYFHNNGTNTVLLTKTFTINASDVTPTTPAKAGLFTAISGGTMSFSTMIPNPPPLVYASGSGDSMAVSWTFTL